MRIEKKIGSKYTSHHATSLKFPTKTYLVGKGIPTGS